MAVKIASDKFSEGSQSLIYQIDLEDKNGDSMKINKSQFVEDMLKLASEVGRRCGVPLDSNRRE